jgi:hypothetical protein
MVEPFEYRTTWGLVTQWGAVVLVAMLAAYGFASGDVLFGVFMAVGIGVAFYFGLVLFAREAELLADGALVLRGLYRTLETNVGDVERISVRSGYGGGPRLGYMIMSKAGRAWIWNCESGRELVRRIGEANPSVSIPNI